MEKAGNVEIWAVQTLPFLFVTFKDKSWDVQPLLLLSTPADTKAPPVSFISTN